MKLKVGAIFTWLKTFNVEETQQFSEVIGYKGKYHMEWDEKELYVQGLLLRVSGI